MRKPDYLLPACLLMVIILVQSFRYADQILKQLGISDEDAQYNIYANFEKGELSFPTSSLLKSLIPEKRAATVKELGDYIRQYTSSVAFQEQYRDDREAARPVHAKEKIVKELEDVKKQKAELEKESQAAAGDMKKLLGATLSLLEMQQKALENPGNPGSTEGALYIAGFLGTAIVSEEEFQAALVKFEQEYPASVNAMLRKRLQQFLDLTADIDFNAKLEKRGAQTVFADPALEAKSYHWKLCFRSGRETITAARSYAQQWLSELK